jgi:hypothetical protein
MSYCETSFFLIAELCQRVNGLVENLSEWILKQAMSQILWLTFFLNGTVSLTVDNHNVMLFSMRDFENAYLIFPGFLMFSAL